MLTSIYMFLIFKSSCLSHCAVISRLLTMFWVCYLDICCLRFVSDVLPNCFLIESLSTCLTVSLTVEILPRPSFMSSMETHFILSRWFFFSSLPICFPFTALLARWVGLWLNTFFSVFEKCSPFLVKYPSFLHLKLWPWNENLHQLCTQSFIFSCIIFLFSALCPKSFMFQISEHLEMLPYAILMAFQFHVTWQLIVWPASAGSAIC